MPDPHPWSTLLASHVPPPDWWAPWSFVRPDGTCSTCAGSAKAIIVIDGNHLPVAPHPYNVGIKRENGSRIPPGTGTDKILDASRSPLPGYQSVPLAALRALAPIVPLPPERSVKCEHCRGNGHLECFHCGQDMDCNDCDGKGTAIEQPLPDPVYVRIASSHIDAHIIAPLLALLPDESVSFFQSAGKPNDSILVRGSDWRLVAMPMMWDGSPPSDSDELPIVRVFAPTPEAEPA